MHLQIDQGLPSPPGWHPGDVPDPQAHGSITVACDFLDRTQLVPLREPWAPRHFLVSNERTPLGPGGVELPPDSILGVRL